MALVHNTELQSETFSALNETVIVLEYDEIVLENSNADWELLIFFSIKNSPAATFEFDIGVSSHELDE